METVKQPNEEVEIDLLEVFPVLLSRWLPIVVVGLVAAMLAGGGTLLFITKKYTASTTLYVYTNPKVNDTGTITNSELSAAENLLKTYQAIIKSRTILSVVSQHLNEEHPEYESQNLTVSALRKVTSVTVPADTKLLEIKAETADPQLSADIANTFARCVPDEIVRITKAGGVEIVDYAAVPKNPSSPSLTKNVAMGLLAGLVASAAFFVLRALLDTTIYSSEEIAKVTSCPVIGSIPHVEITGEAPESWSVFVKEEIAHGS